jgi:hypothetical protein
MVVIMAAKLIIRKECLDSEVHYGQNNQSFKVLLKEASQEQLKVLKDLGVDVFEPDKQEK